MAIHTSGPIALSHVAAEFGGSTPHSLSEYYRGGGLVADTPQNATIPTSGQIQLDDFYGTGAGSPPPPPPPAPPHHTSSGSTGTVSGACTRFGAPGPCTANTGSVTVSVFGGVGPFTYSWAYVSGYTATPGSASSNTTNFSRSSSTPAVRSGVYRCTVTDPGDSNYQTTVDVTVETTHNYDSSK